MTSARVFYGKEYERREAERAGDLRLEATPASSRHDRLGEHDLQQEGEGEGEEKKNGAGQGSGEGGGEDYKGDEEDEWKGWRSAIDELTGATYYYNEALNRSTWEWPPADGL